MVKIGIKCSLFIVSLLFSAMTLADAMCGPNGQFNPNDNRCWPVQSGNSTPAKRIDYWGAIAVHRKGTTTYSVWNQTSKAAAGRKALQNCGNDDCVILISFKNTCAAAVSGRNNFFAVDTDNNANALVRRLMSQCQAKTENCKVWADPVCAGR